MNAADGIYKKAPPAPTQEIVFKVLHLFSGLGGGALGFNRARDTFRGFSGRFRLVGAVDIDAAGNRDFERIVGAPATTGDIAKMTPPELVTACGGESPDAVFLSPPCKGFSGLMSEAKSKTAFYQALNRLVIDGMKLVLEAFPNSPPALILIENVPRIATRGRKLLDKVQKLLRGHGYVFHEGFHDCGEIGGLGQRRRRFLMVARLPARVPNVLHRPPSKKLRTIGDVLGPIALPDDPTAGPMHRLPRLQWRTWLRLALIPAGGDWRDLDDVVDPKNRQERRKQKKAATKKAPTGQRGLFKAKKTASSVDRWRPRSGCGSYGIVPWTSPAEPVIGKGPGSGAMSVADPRFGTDTGRDVKLRVEDWSKPARTIIGASDLQTGAPSVADPRVIPVGDQRVNLGDHVNKMRVEDWKEPARAVIGSDRVGSGAPSVADPRIADPRPNPDWPAYGVSKWDEPAACVTGQRTPGQGKISVADPRFVVSSPRFNCCYRIVKWDEAAVAVTGATGNAKGCVADPRLDEKELRNGAFRVMPFDEPAPAVTSKVRPSSEGAIAVADPRMFADGMGVSKWNEPAACVKGESYPSNGRHAVADPRVEGGYSNSYRVDKWDEPAPTVTGQSSPSNGGVAVADPRLGQNGPRFNNVMNVTPWNEPANTVTSSNASGGGVAVADPRLGCSPRQGTMEVLRWDRPASAVTSSGDVHAQGASAVADPREVPIAPPPEVFTIPADKDRPEIPPVIISLDGTWHRPLTTYELAALQSLPLEVGGEPLVLDGKAQDAWRERIGNAVPPDAAEAIATAMLRTLLMAFAGVWELSNDEVWVLPQDPNDPSLGVEYAS